MAAAKAGAKVEAPAPKAAGKATAGILKPLPVSRAMEKFVGASEISRTGAIKKIWDHIKLNQLQVVIPSCFELPKSPFFCDLGFRGLGFMVSARYIWFSLELVFT